MSNEFRQDQSQGGAYRGPERRKGGDRRKGETRREEIRFEPGKDDRRSGKDRRKQTGWDGALLR